MGPPEMRSPGVGTGARESDHLDGKIGAEGSARAPKRQARRKRYFSPVPMRAIGDQRLSGLLFRVLTCIASHDRMSEARGGQGCWAGNETLAAECGCNYSNLSTAITELGRMGYVQREVHAIKKRMRIYRVIYTAEDEAF